MKKREKKQIDELFKAGLDRSDEPFKEDHWNELERMMDSRKRHYWLKITGLSLLSGAIIFPLLFWIGSNLNPSRSLVQNSKPITTEQQQKQSTSSREHTGQTENLANKPLDIEPERAKTSGPGKESIRIEKPDLAFPSISESEQQRASTDSQQRERPSMTRQPEEVKSNVQVTNTKDTNTQLTEINGSTSTHIPSVSSQKDSIAEEIKTVTAETNITSTESQKDTTVEINKIRKRFTAGTLAILVAPDLTSIPGAGKVRISQNFGVLYSQPIGKKLSISTGVLYARKRYASPYSYYKPENPPVLSEYPTEVNALCDVIDIPILLNLNILDNGRIRLNVGAGISSYFMLKEKYRFTYATTGSYGQQYGTYEIHGQNQHFLGVADFSVSVERKLSERITLGIRPFAKIPLTGIGYGQIKLESKGIAFTLGLDLRKKANFEKQLQP